VFAWLPYVAIALIAIGATVAVFQLGDDDPTGTERWRSLSPAARKRIRRSVRTGALLADPEEIEVAAELAHRARSVRIFMEVWAIILVGLGIGLIVAAIVANFVFPAIIGAFFLLGGLWGLHPENDYREVISRGRGY
jgi:hypothetical protein